MTTYINQLPIQTQEEIKAELITVFTELELSQDELTEAIENAMDSRLCDLSDTININKYL